MKITEAVVLRKMQYGKLSESLFTKLPYHHHCSHVRSLPVDDVGDISTAIRVAEEALIEDPLQHYLRDTPVSAIHHVQSRIQSSDAFSHVT